MLGWLLVGSFMTPFRRNGAFLMCGSLWIVGVLGWAQQAPPVTSPPAEPLAALANKRDLARADAVRDAESAKNQTNIAFLVGIGDYDRDLTGLPSLKYPVPDIVSIGEVLTREGYKVSLLTDGAATAGGIRARFKELAKLIDEGQGTFVFYFSGHGFRAGTENYLATFGTTMSDLASQGLSLTEVQKLLTETGAKRRMAFVDACRNDPEAKSVGLAQTFRDLRESEGLRILYSTAPGNVSYEDQRLRHGVFSYFLIEGLKGKAANIKDGLITFDDLRDYVTDQMKSYSISTGRIQKPYQLGESIGDFLIAGIPHVDNVVVTESSARSGSKDATGSLARNAIVPKIPFERVQTLKTGVVHSATLSPDGRLVALAANDGPVQLWSTESGKIITSLTGPSKPALNIQFSPDAKMLVAVGGEKSLWVWQIETNQGRKLDEGGGAVLSASFSSDGKFLVSSGTDKTVRIWNLQANRVEATAKLRNEGVWSGFSPDPESKMVVVLAGDKKHPVAELWNWQSKGSPPVTLADSSGVSCLAFSRDGRKLVGGMQSGTIKLWDIADIGHPQVVNQFDGHVAIVESLLLSEDGRRLASAAADKTIRWWDSSKGSELQFLDAPPRTERIFGMSFAPDGKLLAALVRSASVEIWQVPQQ